MQIVRNVIAWVVVSSANPDKFSLTLKAGAAFLVLLGVHAELLNGVSEGLMVGLVNAGQLIAAAIGIFGAVRKIVLSFKSR